MVSPEVETYHNNFMRAAHVDFSPKVLSDYNNNKPKVSLSL